jgi:hypothetical protein
LKQRWQNILKSRRVRAFRCRWHKFTDGLKYALGLGPIWVNITCPACEREIEVEAE